MSSMMVFALPTLTAAALAFVLTPLVARLAVLVGAIDIPDARKLHDHPIPRLGGLAVVAAISGVWLLRDLLAPGGWSLPDQVAAGLVLGLLPILAVSLVDDLRGVGPALKCVAHVTGAVIAVACGVSLGAEVRLLGGLLPLGVIAIPVSVLWIVGVTNAFNLIDGLDGLSAGLALISAASMAAVFGLAGQPVMAGASLVLAGALAGFLPYNLHPARLFLGDTGATAIGFALAVFALEGGSTLSSGFAALIPVFIMGLPIADTLVTMGRRLVLRVEQRGHGVFVADRNHIHHRLLSLGIGHRQAVLILYGAGATLAAAALVSMFLTAREAALFVLAVLLAGFIGVRRLGYDEFAFIRKGTVLKLYAAPVVKRSMFAVFVDIAMATLAAYVAVGLKFDAWHPYETRDIVVPLASMLAPLTVVVFWKMGMYRGSWRLAGIDDVLLASKAASGVAVLALVSQLIVTPGRYPASLFLIYGLVSTMLVVVSRASYVILLSLTQRASLGGVPVLIYGAGAGGVTVVRELYRKATAGLAPLGFLDENPDKWGKTVSGLPVFGGLSELQAITKREKAEAVLVATSELETEAFERVMEACTRVGVGLFRMHTTVEQLTEPDHSNGLSDAAGKPVEAFEAAGRGGPMPFADRATPDTVQATDDASGLGSFPPSTTHSGLEHPAPGRACPACASPEIHRSHARNAVERLRRQITDKRLYRCHECDWRGWKSSIESSQKPVNLGARIKPPDFGAIDAVIQTSRRSVPRQILSLRQS